MMHYRTCGFFFTKNCAQYQFEQNTITDTLKNLGTFNVLAGVNSLATNYSLTDTNFFVLKDVKIGIEAGKIAKYMDLIYGTDGTTQSTYCPNCDYPNTHRRSAFRFLVDYSHHKYNYYFKFKAAYDSHAIRLLKVKVNEIPTLKVNNFVTIVPIDYSNCYFRYLLIDFNIQVFYFI
jgi:hypothetical protein